MSDPREAAKAAEKRIKDDDVIRKVPKPGGPQTQDDPHSPSPPTPTPSPTPPTPPEPNG